jgi:hypothetical protein
METVGNNAPLAPGSYPSSPKSYRKHRATKPQLLTRDKIDGRNAARLFDRLVADIQADVAPTAAGAFFVFRGPIWAARA